MSKYTWIGWYNACVKYSWRIIGSHLFFLGVVGLVAYFTYGVFQQVPTGVNEVSTKASVVQTGAVVIGLFSIVLAALQVRVNASWNKVLSYHNHFGELITPDVLQKLEEVARAKEFEANLKAGTAICENTAKAIFEHGHSDRVVSCYLDEFEEFACAVNAGVVDDEYAYQLEGTRVARVWTVFRNYVQHCRSAPASSPTVYKQLQALAHRWKDRKEHEHKARERAQRRKERKGAIGSQV